MASQQPQVVGIGQCSLDLLGRVDRYPPVDQKTELEEVLIQGGGPVATALVVLSRLGVPTAFFGRVGDDEHGRRIRLGLADEGVDCRGLRTDPGATSQFAFIAVEKGSGQRNIFWTRGSARPLAAEEIDREAIAASRVLHLDGLQLEAAPCAPEPKSCFPGSIIRWSASGLPGNSVPPTPAGRLSGCSNTEPPRRP
jgi:ribokinase